MNDPNVNVPDRSLASSPFAAHLHHFCVVMAILAVGWMSMKRLGVDLFPT